MALGWDLDHVLPTSRSQVRTLPLGGNPAGKTCQAMMMMRHWMRMVWREKSGRGGVLISSLSAEDSFGVARLLWITTIRVDEAVIVKCLWGSLPPVDLDTSACWWFAPQGTKLIGVEVLLPLLGPPPESPSVGEGVAWTASGGALTSKLLLLLLSLKMLVLMSSMAVNLLPGRSPANGMLAGMSSNQRANESSCSLLCGREILLLELLDSCHQCLDLQGEGGMLSCLKW